MDKDIPRYERIRNYYKIIGVKDKKQKKYVKFIKDIHRMIGQKDTDIQMNTDKKDKGNKERYFHYEGYDKLIGVENLVEKR